MLKYLKIFALISFTVIFSEAYTQEQKSYVHYDSTTYIQYQKKDWSGLIKTSHKAYKDGIDYYYLRMRTGIAYFENHNYLMARKHFLRAAELNSLDPVSKEYIYYCLLYSGRSKEANLFFIQNKSFLENKVTDKINPIKKISIDVAYHSNIEENLRSLMQTENISDVDDSPLNGFQIITRRFFYSGFLLQHELNKNLDLIHGGSLLRKYNYYYSQEDGNSFDTYEHKINQTQYYAALKLSPGAGFNIIPSFHYIYYTSPSLTYRERGSGLPFTIPLEKYNFYTARLSTGKSFWLMDLNTGVSFSKLSNNKQIQQDITLSFFPLGNLNLYSQSTLYRISEGENNNIANRLVYQEDIGFRINDNLWLEASAVFGEIKNMSTNESYIIYNGTETITGKYMFSFLFPLEKMTFSLRTAFQQYYSTYSDLNGYDLGINKLTFNGYSLIGGLTWNF
jgi:hypothetical protein